MNKRKEVEDYSVHREQDLVTIKELEEYIHKLEHDKNSTLNESANLEEELAVARVSTASLSLSVQRHYTASSNDLLALIFPQ